jgi:hypothetical protein
VVSLACLRGLVSSQAAFLRTPKKKAGRGTVLQAIRSSLTDSLLAALALFAAAVMVVAAPSIATLVLAVLLVYLAGVYSSAVWASTAAEGIVLTPFRRLYLRSAQNTGQRPVFGGAGRLLPLGLIAAGALALLLMSIPATTPSAPAQLPPIVQQPRTRPPASLVPGASPTATPSGPALSPSATPTTAPSARGTPTPRATPTTSISTPRPPAAPTPTVRPS